MIKVASVYQDVQDALLKDANGDISIPLFNRYSKIAELKLMDWLTGDITGKQPPEPYTTQKDKDWLGPFITPYEKQVENGRIPRPEDYYGFENMCILGVLPTGECDEQDDVQEDKGNTPITMLDGGQFTQRQRTYIAELRPSMIKPIVKEVGKYFEFFPKDLGSVRLEYYRYPVFAKIAIGHDDIFNQDVPDEANSTDYEWDEKARAVLIWFIVDLFANRVSNQAMKQFNTATGKTPQG